MNDNPLREEQSPKTKDREMERLVQGAEDLCQAYLLRGPLLIGTAVLLIGFSIVQSLSATAMVQLSLLSLGALLLAYDASRIGNDAFRAWLKGRLDSIVWDDVLYEFWHPDYDWWKVFVDNFLGQASWMYILPSTPEQRIRLLQAGLGVTPQEAERILLAPGGYKNLLLPKALLQWLENDNDNDNATTDNNLLAAPRQVVLPKKRLVVDTTPAAEDAVAVAPSSSSSNSECSAPSPEKESLSDEPVLVEHQDDSVSDTDVFHALNKDPQQEPPLPLPPTLSDTMRSIVQDAVTDQFREVLTYIPGSKPLAGIGITATAALALQLRYSPQARRIARTLLESSALAGLSTLSVGATGLLLAKLLGPRGVVRGSNLVSYVSDVMKLRKSLTSMAGKATSDDASYKKGVLCATIAVALLGFRRRQHFQQKQQTRHTGYGR